MTLSLAARGGAGRASDRPAPAGSPPDGNTGGKPTIQYEQRSVMVHWLRVTHPVSERGRLRAELVKRWGEPDPIGQKWRHSHGERFACGVMLLWGRPEGEEDRCLVDLPGGALESIEPAERLGVIRSFCMGGRLTRLDLALDAWHSDRVGLVDAIRDACARGQLCGAKRWSPKQDYEATEPISWGVTVGLRGSDGSGRFVRCYDKGLETKTLPKGRWERFEVEFVDDCACEVAADVFGSDDWEPRAVARVNGAASFRELDPSGNGALDRRAMCAWWARWLKGSSAVVTVMKRTKTSLERYAGWLRDSALRTLARVAEETGESMGSVVEWLVPDVRSKRDSALTRAIVAEVREWWAGHSEDGVCYG